MTLRVRGRYTLGDLPPSIFQVPHSNPLSTAAWCVDSRRAAQKEVVIDSWCPCWVSVVALLT